MRRRLIVAVSVFLVLLSLVMGFWHFQAAPGLLWHRSLDQVSMIEMAVMRYNERHTNQPASLEVLVNDKLLPQTSSIYASPLKVQKLFPDPAPYLESDYEIFVDGEEVVVQLKPAVSNQVKQVPRLRNLNLNAISARVDPESRVMIGPDPLKQEGR